MKRFYKIASIFTLIFSLLFLYQNCGTTVFNPFGEERTVQIEFATYSQTPTAKLFNLLFPKVYADVTAVSLCVIGFRFTEQSTSTELTVDITASDIAILPTGTTVAEIKVPQGVYSKVEVLTDDACSGPNSVSITNDNGSFGTIAPVEFEYSGEFSLENFGTVLTLEFQGFINEIDNATNGEGIINSVNEHVGTL